MYLSELLIHLACSYVSYKTWFLLELMNVLIFTYFCYYFSLIHPQTLFHGYESPLNTKHSTVLSCKSLREFYVFSSALTFYTAFILVFLFIILLPSPTAFLSHWSSCFLRSLSYLLVYSFVLVALPVASWGKKKYIESKSFYIRIKFFYT